MRKMIDVGSVRRAALCAALAVGAAGLGFAEKLDASKSYYVSEVTFPGYTNETALSGFPVLIRVPSGSPILAETAADGSDVRVTLPDGTLLPHEIDHWNRQGESALWVRLPTLAKGETKVLLYFGGSPEQSLPASDVWADYRGVWHFSGSSADSTANGFDGTDSATPPTYVNAGQIGTVYMGGENNYTVVENMDIWTGFQGHTPGFTVSAWVSSVDNGYNRILSTQANYGDATGFELGQWGNPSAYFVVGKSGRENQLSPAASCANNYVHLTAVFSGGGNKLYVNGELAAQRGDWMDIDTPLTGFFIGARAARDAFWKGGIDEVRMNFAPLSAERIAADYATQSDAAFAEIGEMKVVGAPVLDTSKMHYVSEVTFPGYTNETALSGFPVLIRVPAESPILAETAADGSDVRVTLPDGTLLPHEIDHWDAHGESTLWVRLPTLVKGVTKILLYCGGKPEQSLPASDVWKDYRGVWHFSGSSADSTANGFDGTDSDTPPTYVNLGQIGTVYMGGQDNCTVVTNMDIWTGFKGSIPGFTVSAWVSSQAVGYNRILSTQVPYGLGEQNQTGFELGQWGNVDAYFVVGKQGYENDLKDSVSCYNNYVLLTSVFSGGSNKLYVNGVLAAQYNGWMDIDTPLTGLFIGAKANTNAFWSGGIDEVRMNFAPLSAERIAADYASQSDVGFAQIGAMQPVDDWKVDTTAFIRRCPITFKGIGTTTLDNFPALVRIPAGSPVYEKCRSRRAARFIRFANALGGLVPHEVEHWDPNGESTIWVLLKRLPPTGTSVMMYYRGLRETPSLPASDVWTEYRGVWHFSGSSADSTANGFDGTDSATPPTFETPGLIGTVCSCGQNRYTVVENMDIWTGFQGHTPGFTVSAWVNSLADGYNRILSTQVPYGGGAQNQTGFELCQWGNPSAYYVVGKQGWENQVSGATSCYNNYVLLTAVFSGGTNRLYVNGVLAAEHAGWMDIDTPLTGLFIGAKANHDAFWQGGIDEVRMNFAPLSPERVAADYASQSDATFSQVGEIEVLPGFEPGAVLIVR